MHTWPDKLLRQNGADAAMHERLISTATRNRRWRFLHPFTEYVPPTFHAAFDFGTAVSPLAAGYTRITEATAYADPPGYGWTAGTIFSHDRAIGDDLDRDFCYGLWIQFRVKVTPGLYEVTMRLGDKGAYAHDTVLVWLNTDHVDTVSTAAGEVKEIIHTCDDLAGNIVVTLDGNAGADPNAVIEMLDILQL
jgi:hypothetical protein